jgi:hypothetical protein
MTVLPDLVAKVPQVLSLTIETSIPQKRHFKSPKMSFLYNDTTMIVLPELVAKVSLFCTDISKNCLIFL